LSIKELGHVDVNYAWTETGPANKKENLLMD